MDFCGFHLHVVLDEGLRAADHVHQVSTDELKGRLGLESGVCIVEARV